jgi:group I intron endonuclease
MTDNSHSFYVYAFLRSTDSPVAAKHTPYYIGKGKGRRAYSLTRRGAPRPKDSSFIAFIQEGLTENEAFELEKYCIALYGRVDLGTGILRNLTDGGEGVTGRIVSEEVKERIADAQREEKHRLWGKHLPKETKQKISEAIRGERHPMWGKTHTEESRDKMSRSKQGEKNNRFGVRLSQETRQKMSRSALGRKCSEETKKKMSAAKAKYLYEIIDPGGNVYTTNSLSRFSREHGLECSMMARVVKGKACHYKGWTGRIVETLR